MGYAKYTEDNYEIWDERMKYRSSSERSSSGGIEISRYRGVSNYTRISNLQEFLLLERKRCERILNAQA